MQCCITTAPKISFSFRYPFNIKSSPAYEITYFFSAWSSFYTSVAAFGLASTYIGLCFHVSAQFDILIQHLLALKKMFHDSGSEPSRTDETCKLSEDRNNLLNIELKKFIQLHVKTIDLCELLSTTFAPIVFVHFLVSAFLICGSCLMLFLADPAERMIYMTFVGSGFLDVFLHTYSGHLIIEASHHIRNAAYELDWYKCDLRNQKLILMIMIRTQRVSAIKIPFFSVSLETYIRVTSHGMDID